MIDNLNEEQKLAVTSTEGFIRVIAGAGSGKTRALTHRFAYLVNEIGIIYNPFKGGIQNETLGEGFKRKTPFDKVYKISTEIQEFTFENISVQTNDSQFVNTVLQIQVRIDKEKAFEYFKKYGSKELKDIQSILSNTTQKQLEKVTTQYNIMEVLGEKRDEIVNKTSFIRYPMLK